MNADTPPGTSSAPMNVCFVADAFPKLSETFVLRQVEGLQARGHRVEVICRAPGTAPPGIEVKRRWGRLAPLQGIVPRLHPRLAHRATLALDRIDMDYLAGFDAIVAHFGYQGARVARLIDEASGLPPLVTVFHGHDVTSVRHAGNFGLYEELFRRGALHLPVNETFRDMLVAAGAPPERVKIRHMGIDPDDFPFAPRDWDAPRLELLSVCRLTEKKGIHIALRALARLYRERPDLDWHYRIVGTGEEAAALQDLVRGSPIRERVTFCGARPHTEVRDLLRDSHVFVLPSLTAEDGDAEGIPVSLMEAMSSGALVVSTRHSGIPELISNGESGHLAAEGDADALCDCLCRSMAPGNGQDDFTRAARSRVVTHFNARRQLERLEADLADLVEMRRLASCAPERFRPNVEASAPM